MKISLVMKIPLAPDQLDLNGRALRIGPHYMMMHPSREAWRLKVRVLKVWVIPSFGNHEVPNSIEMIFLDEHDHILEGQVYIMTYFTVVLNHGSYKTIHHEFKLIFLHQTTVVPVDDDVIPKTCFNLFPFSELLNMT
ncbi:hypothetical protein Ahy_A01g000114 [Arachis hypogaea]|uniref:Replication protein A 70 kDa DNA-binding subunit B/D first OB fold domain-containing protein n=1 Tax=Arachis hypogaea TaxID=3818 RepID=A0A445EJP1_ARAHY|nr:hypothetical protein Ahy_A01g000114 [Arachis hypogaea]